MIKPTKYRKRNRKADTDMAEPVRRSRQGTSMDAVYEHKKFVS